MERIILIIAFFAISVTSFADQYANPKAIRGGTYKINLASEPTTLNPLTSQDTYASSVQAYIVESLLSKDIETYEWKPWLAERWEVSKDKKVFTFYLRKNLKFSDGVPITAEDVKFGYDVVFDPKYDTAFKRPYFEGISKVEVVDKYTVKVYAKNTYFKNFDVAAGMIEVLPKHIYGNPKSVKKLNKTILGSGAYMMHKYEKGKRIVLKTNPNWWGWKTDVSKGEYNFEKISFRFIGEENVALEVLKKGKIDFYGLSPEAYEKKTKGKAWKKNVEKFKVVNKTPKGYSFIGLNLKDPRFTDKNVRKALAHLVNRKFMNKKFRYNLSEYAVGPWQPNSEYASKKPKPIMFNPKKALKMLRKAGWKDSDKNGILDKVIDGKKAELSFTLMNPNKDRNKYFTIFKKDAKKAGVDITIKNIEWNSFVKLLNERKFEAVALAWSAVVDPDPKQIWHSDSRKNSGSNFVSYSNPQADKLIDDARNILDKEERKKKLRKVYELISDDMPYIFLFYDKFGLYARNKRMGVARDSFNYGIGTSYWFVK